MLYKLQCCCLAVKRLWRGSFLPICQQRTKTKALCFPDSKQEEGQHPVPPQSSAHLSLALGWACDRAGQLSQQACRPPASASSGQVFQNLVRAGWFILAYTQKGVFMRCYKFHFQKRVSMEAHVRLPCGFPGHHEAFVFNVFTMGKYLKQISFLVCTHQRKNTSECCGLCWEGVAQHWRNYLFTCAMSENGKKKK